jgi:hypothetical protein
MTGMRAYTDETIDVVCQDQSSGLIGRLAIRDDDLRLTLFSFDDNSRFEQEDQRVLELENSEYATLLDCIEGGGLEGTYGRSDFVCRQYHVIPNIVIIGERAWKSSDRVQSLRFKFTGAETALYYTEHSLHRFETSPEGTAGASTLTQSIITVWIY